LNLIDAEVNPFIKLLNIKLVIVDIVQPNALIPLVRNKLSKNIEKERGCSFDN